MNAPRRQRPAQKWANKRMRRAIPRHPVPAVLATTDHDIEVITDVCRTLGDLAMQPPRRLKRDELTGKLLDAWCRLRNLLLWRLPPDQFAALNL